MNKNTQMPESYYYLKHILDRLAEQQSTGLPPELYPERAENKEEMNND